MILSLAIIALPTLAGGAAFLIKKDRRRRILLLSTAAAHLALSVASLFAPRAELFNGWICFDAPGKMFLVISSLLFLAAAFYACGYLRRENMIILGKDGDDGDMAATAMFSNNSPEAVFTGCLLLFLGSMSLVEASQHFGLLWVAMEATTLASAPLIYFHKSRRSLEATWKYLIICSVGIGLALIGNLFLAISVSGVEGRTVELTVSNLSENSFSINTQWLKAAFIFFLVGYGTKTGLSPMHTWLPDAHSEAPALVSALLSGSLLNCAFLGILRVHQVMIPAGVGEFSRELLLLFGVVSIVTATIFIVGQNDFKRMLAYSSVEHMGILALGVGVGGEAVFGAMLHAVNHSLVKSSLFLAAGNIYTFYRTRALDCVGGLLKSFPKTGALWMAGLFAITATPPFGVFISEFVIFKNSLFGGFFVASAVSLLSIGVIFVAMSRALVGSAFGTLPENFEFPAHKRETLSMTLPPAALCALSLFLGLCLPKFLIDALRAVAVNFGG